MTILTNDRAKLDFGELENCEWRIDEKQWIRKRRI